ncbi:right-handed parallel beta-helix repeat-containing protein [Candidatus Eisenbacteria bacterium]|uniref:Right-handed parallel beta-helix repeat-containing protein n=1 Tax=Eiseniibacteriota bacterium TaxID=2212470 RepID=A0ABV6YKI6_UNCEI
MNSDVAIRRFSLLAASLAVLSLPQLAAGGGWTLTGDDDYLPGQVTNLVISGGSLQLPKESGNMSTWITETSLSSPLAGHAATVSSRWGFGSNSTSSYTYLYLAGGRTDTEVLDQVVRYSISDCSFSSPTTLTEATLPDPTQEHTLVPIDAGLLLLGGIVNGQPSDQVIFARYTYDAKLRPWCDALAQLPQPRWRHASVAHSGFVHVIGGSPTSDPDSASSTVYYANPTTDGRILSWSTTPPLPEARADHAAIAVGGFIYVIGGNDSTGAPTTTVYRSEITSDGSLGAWQAMPSLPLPRRGHGAALQRNEIMVVGGREGGIPRRDVFRAWIDDETGTLSSWTSGMNYDFYIADHVMLPCSSGFLVLGGEDIYQSILWDTRHTSLTETANYARLGSYLSPVLNLGDEHFIDGLDWAYTSNGQTVRLRVRTAGTNGVWGSWSLFSETGIVTIAAINRFAQFEAILEGDSTATPLCESTSLDVPSITFVSGSVNGSMWTSASSPYVVTGTITATSGTFTVEEDVEVRFRSGTYFRVDQANVYVNGTYGNEVLWTSLSDSIGGWGGITYLSESDVGVASDWSRAIIEKGGESWAGYLFYAQHTTEPNLSDCIFRKSAGKGIFSYSSRPSLVFCTIEKTAEHGLYIAGGGMEVPNLAYCTLTGSSNFPTVYCGTANAIFLGTTITSADSSALYISHASPLIRNCQLTSDTDFAVQLYGNSFPDFEGNTYSSPHVAPIAIEETTISASGEWVFDGVGYAVVGDLTVGGSSAPTLTLPPEFDLYFAPGTQLRVGIGSSEPGVIHAVGTPDSLITFTSLSGSVGDWNGIDLSNYADNSRFEWCVVEKAGSYGLRNMGSDNITLHQTTFQNPGGQCLYLYSGSVNVDSCSFSGSPDSTIFAYSSSDLNMHNSDVSSPTGCALYCQSGGALQFSGCSFTSDSSYAVRLRTNSYPIFSGNSYNSPHAYPVAVEGGTISISGTWDYDGVGYAILGDIEVGYSSDSRTLTIAPGHTLGFASGTQLATGSSSHRGVIHAVGASGLPITFTSLSGSVGDWNGIDLSNYADNSRFEWCVVEKAGSYGLRNVGSDNLTLHQTTFQNPGGQCLYLYSGSVNVDSCSFSGSPDSTIFAYSSSDLNMHNSDVSSPTGCALYCQSGGALQFSESGFTSGGDYAIRIKGPSLPQLSGNSYSSPYSPPIAIEGGSITSSGTLSYDGVPYEVLGDIVFGSSSIQTLTIEPGVTLYFAPGTQLSAGTGSSQRGVIQAVGTFELPITFTPKSGIAGDWRGIYLGTYSDNSRLERCVIEKAGPSGYNLNCSSVSNLQIATSRISHSTANGLQLSSCTGNVSRCDISYNGSVGIYLTGSVPTTGGDPIYCNSICDNGTYDIHLQTSSNLDATYNWWGSTDPGFIAARIYDGNNGGGPGFVTFAPFSEEPCLDNNPVEHFSLLNPTDAQVVPTLTPQFFWQEGVDPDPGDQVRYKLLVSDDVEFTDPIIHDALVDTSFVLAGPLSDNKAYWWKVIAYDQTLLETPSNETWTLTANIPPTVPEPITPIDGEDANSQTWLVWLASEDPGGAEVTYRIQADDDSSFADPEIDETGLSLLSPPAAGGEGKEGAKPSAEVRILPLGELRHLDVTLTSFGIRKDSSPAGEGDNAFAVQLGSLNGANDLINSVPYYWRVQALDNHSAESGFSDGQAHFRFLSDPATISTEEDQNRIPPEVFLSRSTPNPFRHSTLLRFGLPVPGSVTLQIFNPQGRLVRSLARENHKPGLYQITWDGKDDRDNFLPSGPYFCRLEAGGKIKTVRMIYMR